MPINSELIVIHSQAHSLWLRACEIKNKIQYPYEAKIYGDSMNTNLTTNLKRLYLLPQQVFHTQNEDGTAYYPNGFPLGDAQLNESFSGNKTVALNLISEEGLVRAMSIDFDGVAHDNGQVHWDGLKRVYQALTQELGLPAPAVSISGRKGYGLWMSLDQPIPVSQVQAFLRSLKAAYLSDIPKDQIDLRPDCREPTKAAQAVVKLPPCLHQANKKWSAFISMEDGERYVDSPWMEEKPDLEQQAKLLEHIQTTSVPKFLQAYELLRLKVDDSKISSFQKNQEQHTPDFTKAPHEHFIAPCVEALINKGVPEAMPYHQANLNLVNYCHSANIEKDQAKALAKQLSDNTPGDDRTKGEYERMKHFNSVPAKVFYCDYPRNIESWRNLFGGSSACEKCPINDSKITIPEKNDTIGLLKAEEHLISEVLTLKKEEALDLIKYAWDNQLDLSHIEKIWPVIELSYSFDFKVNMGKGVKPKSRNLSLDWFRLSAHLSGKDNSNATFLHETNRYIYDHQDYDYIKRHKKHLKYLIETEDNSDKIYFIGDNPRDISLNYRQRFFEEIHSRAISHEHGKSTLKHSETKEAKAKLYHDVWSSVINPHYSISDVFANTGRALNEIIRREEQETPFGNKAYPLFQEIFSKRQSVETPFSYLNYLLEGGFIKGRLYVLLAPPKAGKTTFAAACMDFAAASGHPVLYMGYEMGKAQMVLYGLARKTGISASKIQAINLNEEEQETILQAFKSYVENEGKLLTITEACSQYTLANAVAWISLNKNLHSDRMPLVVIDYLQIAFSGIKEIDNHASASERVSQLAVMCKQIARKQDVALLVLSAVTKVGENDSTSKGIIDVTAARDSLAIIHAADGVLSLQTAMVSVKHKDGSTFVVETRDPWEMLESFCREQGNEYEAEDILKGRQKNDGKYPQGKNSANTRAVLYLLRHRGGIGQVPLYYRKALHQFEEVPLCQAHKTYYERYDSTQLLQKAEILFNQEEKPMKVIKKENILLTNDSKVNCQKERLVAMQSDNNIEYCYITNEQEAIREIESLERMVALDLETTGLDPLTAQIRLLSLHDGSKTLVIDLFKIGGVHKLKLALEKLSAVGHNSIFDMQFLHQANVTLLMDCTMIGHHVLTGEQCKLKELSEVYLELEMSKEEQKSDWSQDELTELQLQYAASDAQRTFEIWKKIKPELEQTDSLKVYEITRDAQPSIVQIELTGISFDAEKQKRLLLSLEERKLGLKETLERTLGNINYSSSKQLSGWLTTQLGGVESSKYKKWPKTSKRQLMTGSDELKQHALSLPKEACSLMIDALIPIKDVDKQLSSFGQSIIDKIHPARGPAEEWTEIRISIFNQLNSPCFMPLFHL